MSKAAGRGFFDVLTRPSLCTQLAQYHRGAVRWQSSFSSQQMDLGRHFYLNKVLEQYASKPATRTTLRQLVFFGKTLGRDRDKILKSANYVRHELAVRIAHRIRDLQALPFVVMTNKHLEEVYEKYWKAFETFRKIPNITTLDDNEEFCSTLKKLLQDHLTIIPSLTIGIIESSHHMPPDQLDSFMERMLRSRISRRVLAEQHIALSEALDDPFHFFNDSASSSSLNESEAQQNDGEHVGIIYTSLKVSNVVEKAIRLLTHLFKVEIDANLRIGHEAILPEIVVDGALEARFAYIPEHLEYILFELLKNSMMAVMRQPLSARDPVCIRVTIVEGPPDEDLIIRISDCGGGLPTITSLIKGPKREHRRKFAHRITSRRRREILEEEIAAIRGEKRTRPAEMSNEAAPQQRSPQREEVDDEVNPNELKQLQIRGNQDTMRTIASKAGANDPLVATVTSFSNIRRRLEMEEERLKKLERANESSEKESKDIRGESARRESPGGEKEGIEMGLRNGLKKHEERASGIDSWVKIEALRNMGRFKGTVAEQLTSLSKKDAAQSTSESVVKANDNTEAKANLSKAPHRAETGLGLPMTKIYTDFFGGSLSLRSLDGHGLDVFVRLPKLGTNKETIEDIVL